MVCPLHWWWCVPGLEHYPAFAPSSSEVAVRFLVFLYLVVHNLSQLLMHVVIISPLFLLFCCLRRHLSRIKHASKGSQVSVPACLITSGWCSTVLDILGGKAEVLLPSVPSASAYHLDLNAAHWTILFGLLLKHLFLSNLCFNWFCAHFTPLWEADLLRSGTLSSCSIQMIDLIQSCVHLSFFH